MRIRHFFTSVAVAAVGSLGFALAADAQQMPPRPAVLSAGGQPGQADLDLSQYSSPFNLGALGDIGQAGVRSNGQATMCVTNVAFGGPSFYGGCDVPQLQTSPTGGWNRSYFDLSIVFAAPPSDMPSVINPVTSGLKGGGWTFNTTSLIAQFIGGTDKVWASDRSGSQLLSFGVKTTDDASCTNFTALRDGWMYTLGAQLLPVSTCPPTHPPTGWQGRHLVEEEVYADLFENDPAFRDDPWRFWSVPEERQRTDKFIGDWQSYGEMNDFYFEVKPKYGAVIPGQSGTPQYHGWPMGITVWFDAFYFGLPTTGGTTFWQGTIVNESEKVYGVGVDYDSMYIGINYNPLMGNQRSAQYFDPSRSAILHANTGNDCAGKPVPPGSACVTPQNFDGFYSGGAAIVVLKSPLGDLRNKHFTDPESQFFDPTHPARGDTIGINHQHMCGFGGCYPNTTGRSMRAGFGLIASRGTDVLDGRTTGDLDASAYHRTFRPQAWPTRTGQFNKYVPGVHDTKPIWDYNKDGQPDTIYADACGSRGCVAIWGDTLPSGYAMNYGNISMAAIGPFSIKAGDTLGLVIGFVGASDAAATEASVNNAIDFYMNFFLGPEAAPAPVVVAADATPGSTRDAVVTLFLDNTTEDWVDPFLSRLNVGAELALNPWLDDSIAARANNNVAAIHIFRSCDAGVTYSSDSDCDGDPISDPTSKWGGFGWAPYASLQATAAGDLPNTFVDSNVTAGITYTYVVITETRGAIFNIVRGTAPNLMAETVTFAPTLLGPLSASTTNPNVAAVYVPLGVAAGGARARIDILNRTGFGNVPFDVTPVGTATVGGDFRGIFVDSIIVTRRETLVDGQVVATETTVEGRVLRTVTGSTGGAQRVTIQTFTFTRSGAVTLSGLTASAPTTSGDVRTTIFRGGSGLLLLGAGDTPLLATTTLTGSAATPGTFIGSPDFPFFTVSVNRALGGTLPTTASGQVFLRANGDTIPTAVRPSVFYRTGTGLSAATSASQFGSLALTWQDDAFGPQVPFNLSDRAGLQSQVTTSLSQRAVASTSSTDPALLAAIKAVDASVTIDAEDLRAYKLPFSVRNLTFGRDAQIVVVEHQDSILLGNALDTARVAVPEDVWVPGDVAYIVETVTREARDASGRVILDANGQPVLEQADVATFRLVLGCQEPRLSCDPTVGGRQPSGYIATQPGTQQLVNYIVPIRGGDEVAFRLTPAILAGNVDPNARPDLRNVHVVPNPYIFASQYERSAEDRVLKFTGLPPNGRIRIFDVAGRFIQEINYDAADLLGPSGDLDWDMQTRESLELASGLYIFVLEANGQRKMGKFVIIR